MISVPEAFVLLKLPNSTLSGKGISTETGVLDLECITMPSPESASDEDRNVYLILKINVSEYPLDPARAVECKHLPRMRTYKFAGTSSDPGELTLSVKVPTSDGEFIEKLETLENILEQYMVEFHGPSDNPAPVSQAVASQIEANIGPIYADKDLRGHLVMINEDTGEVIGEVEDRFRIKEDPAMFEKGHENEPVVIEVSEQSSRESDANALEAFASVIPPDQRNWISKSANIVSHAISMTTNLLITTITTGTSFYIAHSAASPHHSANRSPNASGTSTPLPPPLPPRALIFLTSEKTRKGLSTVHTLSGEAVKVSAKTVSLIDNMIRRAMGAKPKRAKYFATGVAASGSNNAFLSPTGAPPLPPRTPSPSPSSKSSFAPPPYEATPHNAEIPALPPRRGASPAPLPLPARASGSVEQHPLTTKDHILISADLILSTLDDATRRALDVGTEQIGKVMGHKYGPEAAQSSLLMAGTARNVGLVYVDMRGIGRRALLKRAGRTFVNARLSNNQPTLAQKPQMPMVPLPKS